MSGMSYDYCFTEAGMKLAAAAGNPVARFTVEYLPGKKVSGWRWPITKTRRG